MRPTLGWQYRKETSVLARFKEMGWIPPSEAKSESNRSGNQEGRQPGSTSAAAGYRAQQYKPLEAPRVRPSDPCSED
jgi:hypothetical protein